MKKDILTRLRAEGNPLISGKRATFYWMGDWAPHLISDLHDWEDGPQPLAPVPGSATPLWSTSLTLPRDTYVEYAFFDQIGRAHV